MPSTFAIFHYNRELEHKCVRLPASAWNCHIHHKCIVLSISGALWMNRSIRFSTFDPTGHERMASFSTLTYCRVRAAGVQLFMPEARIYWRRLESTSNSALSSLSVAPFEQDSDCSDYCPKAISPQHLVGQIKPQWTTGQMAVQNVLQHIAPEDSHCLHTIGKTRDGSAYHFSPCCTL